MPSSQNPDVGERRAAANAGRPLRSVIIAVMVFYVAASLLNGTYLHESASKREFGTVRDLWMTATKPLDQLSTFFKLHLLRDNIETLRKDPSL